MTRKSSKGSEKFLLVLAAAVVILAAFLVMEKYASEGREAAKMEEKDTAGGLMRELQGTVDDEGKELLLQLESEASGL